MLIMAMWQSIWDEFPQRNALDWLEYSSLYKTALFFTQLSL